jgi:hypothetical protein
MIARHVAALPSLLAQKVFLIVHRLLNGQERNASN